MPRRTVPAYCHHKATGQARVRLDGKDCYLGVYGTKESRNLYSQLIHDWLSRQDRAPKAIDVGRLAILYSQHAKNRYRKNGEATSEIHGVRSALRFLVKDYRKLPVSELSPRVVKAVRSKMVESGLARTTVNSLVSKLRRMVKWAVGEELCQASILTALEAIPDLRRDEAAFETEPVEPVPVSFINAIKPFLAEKLWGAVQFQLLTGARPGEAMILRGCDLDLSGDVWMFTPASHKTEHHGRRRVICIGPVGQALLRQYLTTDLTAYVFGTDRSKQKQPYRRDSYTTAIARACRAATSALKEKATAEGRDSSSEDEIPVWSPNQLRHNFATMARKAAGIEASRVLLGHSSAVTTEIYAERDLDAARAVVAKIG